MIFISLLNYNGCRQLPIIGERRKWRMDHVQHCNFLEMIKLQLCSCYSRKIPGISYYSGQLICKFALYVTYTWTFPNNLYNIDGQIFHHSSRSSWPRTCSSTRWGTVTSCARRPPPLGPGGTSPTTSGAGWVTIPYQGWVDADLIRLQLPKQVAYLFTMVATKQRNAMMYLTDVLQVDVLLMWLLKWS